MSQEVSKNLMCVLMRSGVEIWLENDRVEFLKNILQTAKESKFVDLDGQFLNTADISGIFTPEAMEDRKRRKNGEWQDKNGSWHQRFDYTCPGCGSVIPKGMHCGKKRCPYSK